MVIYSFAHEIRRLFGAVGITFFRFGEMFHEYNRVNEYNRVVNTWALSDEN